MSSLGIALMVLGGLILYWSFGGGGLVPLPHTHDTNGNGNTA